jgi:predicted RNase H-like HicB family nuclease
MALSSNHREPGLAGGCRHPPRYGSNDTAAWASASEYADLREAGMLQRSLQVVIYRDGDVFVAQCLNVDVASDGGTSEAARENLREALELYFDQPDALTDYQTVGEAHVEQLTLKSA